MNLDSSASRFARVEKLKSKVNNCRRYANLFVNRTDKKFMVVFMRCKSPFCPYCSDLNRKKLYAKLKHKSLESFRFLTLTLKKSSSPDDDYKKINKCFTKFISLIKKMFPRKKIEYFKMIEIGKNNNLHLHCLVNFYLDVKKISALWQVVTKDSYIVYASRVRKKIELINYVLKYFLKSFESDSEFFALKRRYSHSDLFFISDKFQKSDSSVWSLLQSGVLESVLFSAISDIIGVFGFQSFEFIITNIPPPVIPPIAPTDVPF